MIINHQITKHDFQTNSLWANHHLHHRPSLGSVGGSLVPSWMGTRPGALQFRKKGKDRIWGDPMNLSGRNICNYVHKYIYNNYVLFLLLIVYIYICVYNHANTHQIYDHSNICNTWAGRKQLATILKQPWPSWWTIRQSVLGPLDKLCVYIYDHIYDHYILL